MQSGARDWWQPDQPPTLVTRCMRATKRPSPCLYIFAVNYLSGLSVAWNMINSSQLRRIQLGTKTLPNEPSTVI